MGWISFQGWGSTVRKVSDFTGLSFGPGQPSDGAVRGSSTAWLGLGDGVVGRRFCGGASCHHGVLWGPLPHCPPGSDAAVLWNYCPSWAKPSWTQLDTVHPVKDQLDVKLTEANAVAGSTQGFFFYVLKNNRGSLRLTKSLRTNLEWRNELCLQLYS